MSAPPARTAMQGNGTAVRTAHVDVLIVGAGPAGLAAALALRALGVARVLIVEREEQAGGIPRHSAHTGFGLRDLHRLLSGPPYAAHYVRLAREAGRTGADDQHVDVRGAGGGSVSLHGGACWRRPH